MYRRLKEYAEGIEALLAANDPSTNWEDVAREHLVQISLFQHERLVHLLVTLAFALMELASAFVALWWPTMLSAALAFLFLALLVPYIVHYYHLENGTQRLYAQYDRIRAEASRMATPQSGMGARS
jgi:Flp pilus assembly protein TadB